jgi:acyl-CoA synthetase (AMP-forming)/AMP-acid ligase II
MIKQPRSLFLDLERIAASQPDKVALLDINGRKITYRHLLSNIECAHAWLNKMGLQRGDSLIALLPNALETAILFLASLRAGLVYAPLPCTATLPEIKKWKKLTGANLCLLAKPVSNSLQAQIKEVDWRVEIISIGGESLWPENENVSIETGGALVMASSGSTGEPKAMLLSGDRLWSSAKAFLSYHNLTEGNIRFWNYLPMSYLGGLFNLTLIPLAAGGSAFIDDAFNGKTFLGFWSTAERFEINSLWLVPSILRGLLTLSNRIGQNRSYPKVQYCFLGTAPILLEEKQRFAQVFGIQPLENFGLSETTFVSSERAGDLAMRSQNSVGALMPDVDLQLRSTDKGEEPKEIWVKTPYCMLGYLNERGISSPPLDDQGFMPTGDFGQVVDGQLHITGRKRDIIKKGGVLILLREVEQIVSTYPKVIEVAAVRVEHAFYGESFYLYVSLDKTVYGEVEYLKELSAWLHEQLVKDKWPEKILLCQSFPKTSTGKVQKHLLKERSAVNV